MVLKVKRSATFTKKEKSKGKISEEIQEKAQFEGFKSLASAYLAEKKKILYMCRGSFSPVSSSSNSTVKKDISVISCFALCFLAVKITFDHLFTSY